MQKCSGKSHHNLASTPHPDAEAYGNLPLPTDPTTAEIWFATSEVVDFILTQQETTYFS